MMPRALLRSATRRNQHARICYRVIIAALAKIENQVTPDQRAAMKNALRRATPKLIAHSARFLYIMALGITRREHYHNQSYMRYSTARRNARYISQHNWWHSTMTPISCNQYKERNDACILAGMGRVYVCIVEHGV